MKTKLPITYYSCDIRVSVVGIQNCLFMEDPVVKFNC